VQIVLYIGGIMVLFLFVIMLVNLDRRRRSGSFNRQWGGWAPGWARRCCFRGSW
jgi:NADH:ubiquinone oxidoreductase subunit 6 (subunit J)